MIHFKSWIVSIIGLSFLFSVSPVNANSPAHGHLSRDLSDRYSLCLDQSGSNLGFQSCALNAEAGIDSVLYNQYDPYLSGVDEVIRYYTKNFFRSFESFAEELCQVSNSFMYSQSGFELGLVSCRFALKTKLRQELQKTYECHQSQLEQRPPILQLFGSCPNFRLENRDVTGTIDGLQPVVNHYHHFMNKYLRSQNARRLTRELDRRTTRAVSEYNQFVVNYCAMSSFLLDDGKDKNDVSCRRYMTSKIKVFVKAVFDKSDFL